MYYFAYGSNMSVPRLRRRVTINSVIGGGALAFHKLMFRKLSNDGSAKCDIKVTSDNSDVVYGVVFDLPDSDIEALDKAEGLGKGYDSKTVKIELLSYGNIEALTYYATRIDETAEPYHWYKKHVVYGATAAELPASYVLEIENTRSKEDANRERSEKELRIYL